MCHLPLYWFCFINKKNSKYISIILIYFFLLESLTCFQPWAWYYNKKHNPIHSHISCFSNQPLIINESDTRTTLLSHKPPQAQSIFPPFTVASPSVPTAILSLNDDDGITWKRGCDGCCYLLRWGAARRNSGILQRDVGIMGGDLGRSYASRLLRSRFLCSTFRFRSPGSSDPDDWRVSTFRRRYWFASHALHLSLIRCLL